MIENKVDEKKRLKYLYITNRTEKEIIIKNNDNSIKKKIIFQKIKQII